MTTEDRKEIISYLTGPRNFAEGVRLYGLHGQNRMLKRRFAVDDTEFTRTLLVEELRKLAGLSDAEFRRLPRLARRQPVVTETVPQPQKESCNVPAPESVMRMVRFRDRYPFLKYPDCPDILKVLVADMFTAYDAYRESFERLQEMPDEATAESMAEAEKTVTAYLNNRAIWAELDHYRDTGLILGNHPKLRDTAERYARISPSSQTSSWSGNLTAPVPTSPSSAQGSRKPRSRANRPMLRLPLSHAGLTPVPV